MSGDLKLLPCPFCGEPRVSFNPKLGHRRSSINCPACLVCMPEEAGEDELWQSWNARATDWQPIETAPMDTIVLVCGYGLAGYYVADAKQIDGDWFLFVPDDDAYSAESSGHTHWMPRPQPPAIQ